MVPGCWGSFFAAKCSTKNHFGSLSACLSYLKMCDLTQYFFADAPIKKNNQKFSLPPLIALLGHPVPNIFFDFIKIIFLQPLVGQFLDINDFFWNSGTPWDPPTNKMKIFTYEVLGIKIYPIYQHTNMACGAHF